MFDRFAQSARTAVDDAKSEAWRRGDRRIGTEHLLLALLHDEALARIVGVDATAARDAAEELDRSALAAVGLGLGEVPPTGNAASGRRLPLTPGAKTVIQQALASAATTRARSLTSRHMLLALLDRDEPDPAATLLAALAVDPSEVRGRIAGS